MKRGKIKNSLAKGRLFVTWHDRSWEVTQLFTNKVLLKNDTGEMFQVHVHELEFKEFFKNG